MYEKYLDINPEVKKALDEGRPVVALESTIISHGMPYPQNVETARKVEEIVRENGAVPATIAIINGRLKAGLTPEELEYFGKEKGIIKASRRDIPFIVSKGLDGATTVASTMIIANLAGIKVFVTGGIGGVHRGASESFDISADLQELSKTDVAVVCAGVKSILDIGLTLEYLETNGVPVVGYKTDEMPAFYSRKSGFSVDYKAENPKEIADALKTKWGMDLKGGMIIANPIKEEDSMDHEEITKAINDALFEAGKLGIKGKNITPYLLGKVKDLTEGKSLESNIKLVYNNAMVGAQIAVEFRKTK
ncbi:pseudouridine-5'-phosphate glycosidase [Clostridiaceae bacterium HSG29]|nr:pseudouridine-5'-phosphate glycosidase [Clostridiaceae bacterium HSG29]